MSSAEYNARLSENKTSPSLPSILSASKDNSLADFRSPRLEVIPKVIINNFKPTSKKLKKTLSLSKGKSASKEVTSGTNKQTCSAKANCSQPSIESSFFKSTTNVKTAYLCPLCFKPHKDENAQTLHMKSCAARNNVSTRKLLAAKQLQERQAEERRAMGLLTAPIVQEPRRSISRKLISHDDPQLQMGLALSISMQEIQQKEELEVAMLLAGESNQSTSEFTSEDYRKTLQCFGFTTNKPVVAHSVKESKKKKYLAPTVLQTRTQEERGRILAERITEILIGDEAITQELRQQMETVEKCKRHVGLKNSLLERFLCTEHRLWDKTTLITSCQDFYVKALSPVISSVKQQRNSDEPEKSNPVMSKSNDRYEDALTVENRENVPVSLDENIKTNVKPIQCCHVKSAHDTKITKKMKKDEQSSNVLAMDWLNTLNTSSMSDVIVSVKGEHHIWAHTLVFFVRCSNIMLDITPNNSTKFPNIKQTIYWPDIDYCTALAFLEFIYCNVIERYSYVFDDSRALIQIKFLAKKYQVNELFIYLIKRRSDENKCNFCGDLQNVKSVDIQTIEEHDECDIQRSKVSLDHGASKCQMEHSQVTKNQFESNFEENDVKSTILKCQMPEEFDTDSKIQTNTEVVMKSVDNTKISCDEPDSTSVPSFPTRIDSQQLDNVEILEKNQLQVNSFRYREGSVSPDMFEDSEENNEDMNEWSKENCNTLSNLINQDSQCNVDRNVNSSIPLESNITVSSDITMEKDNFTNYENFNLKFENVTVRRKTITSSSSIKCSNNNSEKISLKSNNMEQQIIDTDTIKQKSDLSLLIEKMRRQNARSVSDSDTETESPLKFPMKHYRNPFSVMQNDESYIFPKKRTEQKSHTKVLEIKRNALSLFEEDIRKCVKSPNAFNLTSFKGIEDVKAEESVSSSSTKISEDLLRANTTDDVLYVTQSLSDNTDRDKKESSTDISDDDKDESMYTRYRKKCRRNSIDKYRTALKNCMWHNIKSDDTPVNELSKRYAGVTSESVKLYDERNICHKDHTSKDNPCSADKNIRLSNLRMHKSNSLHVVLSNDEDEEDMKNSKYLNDKKGDIQNNTDVSSNEPVMINDNLMELKGNKKDVIESNLSDVETDVDCYTGSVSYSKRSKQLTKKKKSSDYSIDTEKFNVYEDETDTEEQFVQSQKSVKVLEESPSRFSLETKTKKVNTPIKKKLFKLKKSRETTEWIKRNSLDLESKRKVDFFSKSNYRNYNSDGYESDNVDSFVDVNLKESSNVSGQIKNLLQERKSEGTHKLSQRNNDELRDPSPILICSSPEIATNDFSIKHFKDNDTGQDVVELNDCNEIENLYTNNIDVNNTNDTFDRLIQASEKIRLQSISNSNCCLKIYEKKNIERTNELGEKISKDDENVPCQITRANHISPNSPCNKFKGVKLYDMSDNLSVLNDTLGNEKHVAKLKATSTPKSLRHSSISPEKRSKRVRTFKAKSISEGNFAANSKHEVNDLEVLFDRSSPWANSTPTQKRFEKDNQITPPANYSAMRTPELRQELQKYGLKAQKRNKAKQLLRYIYNELHPSSPTINENVHPNVQSSSSEDERPPPKKVKITKTRKEKKHITEDNCKEKYEAREENKMDNDSDGSIIIEEMEPDKPNSVSQTHSSSIKDAFWKLIDSNKELHNRILTYEPLDVESLHATLKIEGFKCKLDALKDFLDEECITFRQQTQFNKNKTKKKIKFKASDKQ